MVKYMSKYGRACFLLGIVALLVAGWGRGISSDAATTNAGFIISPKETTAGDRIIVTLEFTAPSGGMAVGGNVYLPYYLKCWSGLTAGLEDTPGANSMVTARRSDGGDVTVRNVKKSDKWINNSDLQVTVENTVLPAGERIILTFGNPANKIRTTRKESALVVEATMDAAGNGSHVPLTPQTMRVHAQKPEQLFIVGPSSVSVGETVSIIPFAHDQFGNVCDDYTNELTISVQGQATPGKQYRMHARDLDKELDRNAVAWTFEKSGVYYIVADDAQLNFRAVSNPIRVTEEPPADKWYWGDLHIHTRLSDGMGELAEVYQDAYARGHDFVAITDHGFGRARRGTERQRLNDICRNVNRFHREGEFVTIPAGETHYLPMTHMNLYFQTPDVDQILRLISGIAKEKFNQDYQGKTSIELKEIGDRYWSLMQTVDYNRYPLAFSHHTMWQGIREFINDDRKRLLEIYSTHGSSEARDAAHVPKPLRMNGSRLNPSNISGPSKYKYSAREALNEGHRLGFVGASDTHTGQAGANALTAISMPRLSRDGVLKSLYNRQCYATSANRTLLEFDINGVSMGQVANARSVNMLHGFVAAHGVIDRVEIIGDGEVVWNRKSDGQQVMQFDWQITEPHGKYYYIRALMNDGNDAAWSSPIWFE
jgi:hypothetical protein